MIKELLATGGPSVSFNQLKPRLVNLLINALQVLENFTKIIRAPSIQLKKYENDYRIRQYKERFK